LPIYFHTESPLKFNLKAKRKHKAWLQSIVEDADYSLGEINIVFCDDDYLLKINREHLNHDYYTDIITFDYCEEEVVSGDLFISLDRVKDNADQLELDWKQELRRVMVHGVLHLLGQSDKSSKQEKKMRAAEDAALKKLSAIL